jgi:acyl homoserine lactone synthase
LKNIVFDMSNMHMHGSAFYDFLRLRKRFFIDGLGWDIPTDGIVEMDQYDTPLAHYSLVEHDGEIIAGARCQPTNVSWGHYTCMMKDAARGLLSGIPADLFDVSTCGPELWEGTRLVVADEVRSTSGRLQCLALTIDGLMRTIAANGGTSFMTLSPLPLQRTARMVGLDAARASKPYTCDSDGREYAVFQTRVKRSVERLVALGIDPETYEVLEDGYRQAV